jgi:small subunit ribosomal protein S6
MLRPYEVVYIFDPALEDEIIAQKLTQFHALLATDGAGAPTVNHWGRRTLAYPIKKRTTGYYVVANFETEPSKLPEFERAIRLDEGVLRFLVVLNDNPPTPPQPIPSRVGEIEEEEE